MHTTKKYIFGCSEIATQHLELGTKTISIKSLQRKSKKIISLYHFNSLGRIRSIQKAYPKGGWKAYPAGTGEKFVALPEGILNFQDDYIYSKLGNILRIESFNKKKEKQISTKHFLYKNGFIVGEKEDNKDRATQRKQDGSILQITETKSFLPESSVTSEIKFSYNQENQVVKKEMIISTSIRLKTIAKSSPMYQFEESFNYNVKGQLIDSLTSLTIDNESMLTKQKFKYLDKSSDLIKSIKFKNPEASRRIINYDYDTQQRLIRKATNSQKGKELVINYLRTYK